MQNSNCKKGIVRNTVHKTAERQSNPNRTFNKLNFT